MTKPRPLAPKERIRKSFTYGVLPDWKLFKNNFHAPDEDDHVIELYTMKLVTSDSVSRIIYEGYHSFNDRELYALVKKLAQRWNTGRLDADRAGDLASSILYTLGFEWV